jgi:hypothetical protein
LWLYVTHGFTASESFLWGLADPRASSADLAGCMSKRRLHRRQDRMNPTRFRSLTQDKAVFYAFCTGSGIPVPDLYAVIGATFSWCPDGSTFSSRAACEEFLSVGLPEAFVVKPASGTYGRGFMAIRRADGAFVDHTGSSMTAAALYDALARDARYRKFVVQQRLESHPALVRLSDTRALQTVRMVTYAGRGDQPSLLFATLKVIGGQSISDNFSFGRGGNLLVDVDLETGALRTAVSAIPGGVGLAPVPAHPKTGVPFDGFRLPWWAEARDLLSTVAAKFSPLRTVGWDVALTPDGPIVVEGNIFWDPLQNAHRRMATFLDAVRGQRPRNASPPSSS